MTVKRVRKLLLREKNATASNNEGNASLSLSTEGTLILLHNVFRILLYESGGLTV